MNHPIFLLAIFLLVAPTIVAPSALAAPNDAGLGNDEIFSDNFESGDLSAWSEAFGAQAVPLFYCEDFEDGVLGPEWQAIPGAPESIAGVESIVNGYGAAYTGIYGLALGRSVDGAYSTSAVDLHVDLSGQNNIDLSFWLKNSWDSTNNEDGIYFSDDGGLTFQKAYTFDLSDWTPNAWGQLPPIDVDSIAAFLGLSLNEQFVIRFQQFGWYDFDSDGIMIDDVKLYDPLTEPATLPFSDGFESGTLGRAWAWGEASATSFPATTVPGGLVEVTSNIQGYGTANLGFYGAVMGRRYDGNYTSNALDLHLDLTGESQVELSFWVKDHWDSTDSVDGIYFSHDGGDSFTKVWNFDQSNWVDNSYGRLPPLDVDLLAADNGLTLNDQFVIRFQQYGWYDFDSDGLMIDDVEVQAVTTTYASLPFVDGFETGELGPAWKWGNPVYPALTTVPGTTKPGGMVEVMSNVQGYEVAHLGNYGVALGRRTSGSYNANALDLRVNLAGQSQVELRFWMKDNWDSSSDQDAIFFSSDGGQNFRRVYNLDPGNLTNGVFQEIVLDVDALASSLGISLTDTFVIRFQQYGWYDFSSDGFMIDDVSVTVP